MKNPLWRFAVMLPLSLLVAAEILPAAEDDGDAVRNIDVNAAHTFVTQHDDAIIVDVRTPAEFDLSHITGAMNIDVQDDNFADRVSELDPDQRYVVHCTKNPADGRSSRALETLQSLGFRNLYSLEGGYIAWKDAALPLTEADAGVPD